MDQIQRTTYRIEQDFLTPTAEDAYQVVSGSLRVYLVRVQQGRYGKRSFLLDAAEGTVFPGYKWQDQRYQNWQFLVCPNGPVELAVIPGGSTRVLQKRFCEQAGMTWLPDDGFAYTVLNHVQMIQAGQRVTILADSKNEAKYNAELSEKILEVFSKNKKGDIQSLAGQKGTLYHAVAALCATQNIPIAPLEKIRKAVGAHIRIEDIASISNFAIREVVLEEGWEQCDSGPLLAFTESGKQPVACIPEGTNHYVAYNAEEGTVEPVTKKLAAKLEVKAWALYRPLPSNPLHRRDILRFAAKSVRKADLLRLCFYSMITALVGLMLPVLNRAIYDTYIPRGSFSGIVVLCVLVGSFMMGNLFFTIVKALSLFRLKSHISIDLQSAFYIRLFNLPQDVIESYACGDLTQRIASVSGLSGSMAGVVITTTMTVVFNLAYFFQLFRYSSKLAWICLFMLFVYCLINIPIFLYSRRRERKIVALGGTLSSQLMQFVAGVAKLRMAGAETRALYQYISTYAEQKEEKIRLNRIASFGSALDKVLTGLFTLVIYYMLTHLKLQVSLGSYMAFMVAFGTVSSTVLALLGAWKSYYLARPSFERLAPFLEAVPEVNEDKVILDKLEGKIEVSNVSFRYEESAPFVLRNLSLTIQPGEYLGIVGPSGCGKSTLFKILMGFETPQSGKVYYDGHDLDSLNKRELRKRMGVVLQNDTTITGSIIDNIRLTCPDATYDQVMQVVRKVGLEPDIRSMPMGIRTVMSERGSTISGGQRQRITIARALINRPKVMFFDEATSALDNVTQDKVVETIESIDSTRIVIAHRLSTIIRCDRIVVLDKGNIVESGSYEELMAKRGVFYELASRQLA